MKPDTQLGRNSLWNPYRYLLLGQCKGELQGIRPSAVAGPCRAPVENLGAQTEKMQSCLQAIPPWAEELSTQDTSQKRVFSLVMETWEQA